MSNLQEVALNVIMDIAFDPSQNHPDEIGKYYMIEGVLNYMMAMEDADDNTTYRLTEDDGKRDIREITALGKAGR